MGSVGGHIVVPAMDPEGLWLGHICFLCLATIEYQRQDQTSRSTYYQRLWLLGHARLQLPLGPEKKSLGPETR
jgi:hypothetical protein